MASAAFLELKIHKYKNRNPKTLPAEAAQTSVAFIQKNNSTIPILLNLPSGGWEQKSGQYLSKKSVPLPAIIFGSRRVAACPRLVGSPSQRQKPLQEPESRALLQGCGSFLQVSQPRGPRAGGSKSAGNSAHEPGCANPLCGNACPGTSGP